MSDASNKSPANARTETGAAHVLSAHYQATMACWRRIAEKLKDDIARLDDNAFLAERPATKFILTWMRELSRFQSEFGQLFGRRKRPSAGDEFTAAVGLSLEQFLASRNVPGRIRCEENTHQKRGATKPDVSVRSITDQLVATVECKTDLGWDRKEWKNKCEKRAEDLGKLFPGVLSFLCVQTSRNWDSSEFEKSPHFGNLWFCLSTVSTGHISDPIADSEILSPIEPMFFDILAKVRSVNDTEIVDWLRRLSPQEQQEIIRHSLKE